MFAEKYLRRLAMNKESKAILVKYLVKPPYSVGFGSLILQKPTVAKDLTGVDPVSLIG